MFFKQTFSLTGASRTDKGVHALQNYFHFDVENPLEENRLFDAGKGPFARENSFGRIKKDMKEPWFIYNLNAILPSDIVIKRVFQVDDNAHCRFEATSRAYKYFLYSNKDPFLQDRAYYYPYKIDINKLNEAAALILKHNDFTSFSKKNTQVNNFICTIYKSEWVQEGNLLVYIAEANRFLRGMVKGLVGTMLLAGTGKISLPEFRSIMEARNSARANFAVPSKALFLIRVVYNNW